MRFLAVHPSCLLYSEIFLRLEPLGLELVAEVARKQGHEVRMIDLQVENHRAYRRMLHEWRPDVVAFSCNYLANVPEIIDLVKETKALLPDSFVLMGGHSASFTAEECLMHAAGTLDCVLTGEGEVGVPLLLDALAQGGRRDIHAVPGAVTLDGRGPPPTTLESLDDHMPARDLLRHRRKYFIGVLDPAASIEFSRGCPWDCAFCSAWTFYGRRYRLVSPERAVDDLARVREPGVFIVDDVAFVQADHGMAIADEIQRRGIKKRFYLETRGDVLLRNREVFARWKEIGLTYMFLGLEAIDEEGLRKFRKRVTLSKNFEALEVARSLGIQVAINIIADPDWDERRFEVVREWALESPEIVNMSINTPYPGTETWLTESRKLATRDYRLFDIQHAVLPTRLPLERFYEEVVETQRVMRDKHLGWRALRQALGLALRLLLKGQTNFVRMLWKFNSSYNPERQVADHKKPVKYEISVPPENPGEIQRERLYVLQPPPRRSREAREGAQAD
ncbi:MAG: hopanoid C-3 methylase HpnR [Gemmatimonadetes bacterium]|nr:MAG: hopanoid C-3 methylase HpnR [Gemmatimonadota bacterium]